MLCPSDMRPLHLHYNPLEKINFALTQVGCGKRRRIFPQHIACMQETNPYAHPWHTRDFITGLAAALGAKGQSDAEQDAARPGEGEADIERD
jgi:hypothetical protein